MAENSFHFQEWGRDATLARGRTEAPAAAPSEHPMSGFLRREKGRFQRESYLRSGRSALSLERLEDRTTPSVMSPNVIAVSVGGVRPASGTGLPAGFSPARSARPTASTRSPSRTAPSRATAAARPSPSWTPTTSRTSPATLRAFDATFGLPAPPSFTVVNQTGGAALPAADPTGAWRSASTWSGPTPSRRAPTSSSSRPTAPTAPTC